MALDPHAGHALRHLRSAAQAAHGRPAICPARGTAYTPCLRVTGSGSNPRVRSVLLPPLALGRLTETSGGHLLYQFHRLWSDASTARLLDPTESPLERLVATGPA